jgi:hypothetical protein
LNASNLWPETSMYWIVEARPLQPYRLWLRFSDGVEGIADLGSLFREDHRTIVRELQDPALFADVRVENDTVVWGNGLDLAPEYLRERLGDCALA